MADVGVFSRYKSFGDFQEEAKAKNLKEALAGAQIQQAQTNLAKTVSGRDLPAALQLANEYQKRVASGDLEGANTIAAFAKTTDKGLVMGPDGNYYVAGGYAPAVGEIAAVKAGMSQQAKKEIDAAMNPMIKGAETAAQMQQQGLYAPGIEFGKAMAKGQAEIGVGKQKKATQASNMLGLVDEAEALLPQATSGALQAAGAKAQNILGVSTPATQADRQLEIISAGLVSNVPRMEGPQSDRDVQMYREAAGDIANRSIPYKDRLAALQTIKSLQSKYASTQVNSLDDVLAQSQGAQEPQATPKMKPSDISASLFNARKAIKKNPANREAVIQRLQAAGIPTEGL